MALADYHTAEMSVSKLSGVQIYTCRVGKQSLGYSNGAIEDDTALAASIGSGPELRLIEERGSKPDVRGGARIQID
jgi:hypothetical protein